MGQGVVQELGCDEACRVAYVGHQQGAHFVGDGDIVGAGLRDDGNGDHGYPAFFQHTLFILGTKYGFADIFQTDVGAVHILNDKVVEFFFGIQPTEGADRQFGCIAGDLTRRQFYVLPLQGSLYVGRSEGIGAELGRGEPDAHGVFLFAPYQYITYAGNGLQPLHDIIIGEFGYLE